MAIDVTDPARPHLARTASLASQPQAGFALDERRLLVIEGLDSFGWATGPLSVSGDLACVRDGSEHLSVINVGDPAWSRVIGEYSTPSFINAMAQVGSLVFVLADGLYVLDLATPSSPKLLAQLPTINGWSGIAFEGARAFLVVESREQDDAPAELITRSST